MGIDVSIDIDDFLTHADKVAIARDAFAEVARKKSATDFERILSNAAYELVGRVVDEAFDGGMAALVKEKSIAIIKGLGEFTVFRKPDAWGTEPSKGWQHLQSAMDEANPAISARVHEIVAAMDYDTLRELIEANVVTAIIAKLQSPNT